MKCAWIEWKARQSTKAPGTQLQHFGKKTTIEGESKKTTTTAKTTADHQHTTTFSRSEQTCSFIIIFFVEL